MTSTARPETPEADAPEPQTGELEAAQQRPRATVLKFARIKREAPALQLVAVAAIAGGRRRDRLQVITAMAQTPDPDALKSDPSAPEPVAPETTSAPDPKPEAAPKPEVTPDRGPPPKAETLEEVIAEPVSEKEAASAYWGGGGNGGGVGGGGGGKDKAFDQDDLAGLVIGVLMLLLLGFFTVTALWRAGGNKDERVARIASLEPAPTPTPDPYGSAPLDLRPAETPDVTPTPEAAPTPAPAVVAPAATPTLTREPALSSAASAACPTLRTLRVYFCTAESELRPEAAATLTRQLEEWAGCRGQALVVRGYADARGGDTFNTELAARRAAKLSGLAEASGLSVKEAAGIGEVQAEGERQNCPNQRRADLRLGSDPDAPADTSCAPAEDQRKLACPR